MREILFRGKRIDNGEWTYGWLFASSTRAYIVSSVDDAGSFSDHPRLLFAEVDPATVGQYTGLNDKNGKRIFEGDIVRNGYSSRLGEFWDDGNVVYVSTDGCFEICNVGERYLKRLTQTQIVERSIEVIGNIHDKEDEQ